MLALGSVDPCNLDTVGLGVTHALPFVTMTACSGTPLDVARLLLTANSRQSTAARLGRLTGQLHSLPLPDARLLGTGDAAAPFTLWQSRDGLDLSFRPVGAETGSAQALLEHLELQQHVDTAAGTACVRLGSPVDASSPATDGVFAKATVETASDESAARRLWRPFADFLRERRRDAPGELAWEHSLPRRLLDQLEAYLPPNPAAFLPNACAICSTDLCTCTSHVNGCTEQSTAATHSSTAAGASPESVYAPSWLHGDLIAQNILVAEPLHTGASCEAWEDGLAPDAVQLIDFGDAGHGDPLYDLVLLLIEALR